MATAFYHWTSTLYFDDNPIATNSGTKLLDGELYNEVTEYHYEDIENWRPKIVAKFWLDWAKDDFGPYITAFMSYNTGVKFYPQYDRKRSWWSRLSDNAARNYFAAAKKIEVRTTYTPTNAPNFGELKNYPADLVIKYLIQEGLGAAQINGLLK